MPLELRAEGEGFEPPGLSAGGFLDRRSEGVALARLGDVAWQRGELDEAAAYYERALVITREIQYRRSEGVVLYSLALLAERRGDLQEAETLYRECHSIAVEVKDGPGIADSLLARGRLLIERLSRRDEGCNMLRQAIALYHELGPPGEARARSIAQRLGCQPGDADDASDT